MGTSEQIWKYLLFILTDTPSFTRKKHIIKNDFCKVIAAYRNEAQRDGQVLCSKAGQRQKSEEIKKAL
jgi:hypothetical protein